MRKAPSSANRRGNRGGSKRSKSEEETRCVCGQQPIDHEGLMIQCELCKVWQHCACVEILDEKDCPEQYFCERCKPENHLYLQYYKNNLKLNSMVKTSEPPIESEVSTQPDIKSTEEVKEKQPLDQEGPETNDFSALSDRDANEDMKREARSKRTKNISNRSQSPISSSRKAKDSESDEEYLTRGERKKKKTNSKSEDREYTISNSRSRKRDSKSCDYGDDETPNKIQEEAHIRKPNRKEKKEHVKEYSSSHELETPQVHTISNDEAISNGKRKKPRKISPEQPRNSTRSKENGQATLDNRRSPPVRIKSVSNRMSFHDMSKRTKYIFDCITRIQISMAEKAKKQNSSSSVTNGKGGEPTTMEMVEGLTRKLVQFQELYGEMR
ncbi:Histone deacetylase complex subunit [Basidiobolus ranarum]|uniref:Histone deacetylase complex subunit n=1 Tax=Basidiobolus ranarum TaxID=34480 RepID=A0ABR2WUD4_9FUNG